MSLIRLASPDFDERDLDRLRQVLTSGWLVQGPFVRAFEEGVRALIGQEAIACASGTAALHLALLALGIGPGDEVLVPSFTWPATAATVVQVGARPVFVDVDLETLAMIPAAAEAAITEATRAMVPVHLFGIPAPMAALMTLAVAHDLRVIEDAACALGTDTDRGPAGTVGDVGCFSFHPRKSITTGEGGVVTTRGPGLAARLRSFLNHGIEASDAGPVFHHAGLNYRLSDVAGALGVGQLEKFEAILATKRRLGGRYLAGLADLPVRVPQGLSDPGNTFQSLVVELESEASRDTLITRLRSAEIQCTIGTYAVTSQPYYQRAWGVDPLDSPNADRLMRRLITLPLHHKLSDADVDRVIAEVRRFFGAR